MMHPKFESIISQWTPDMLAQFYAYRANLLLHEDGNICTPAVESVSPYAPFDSSDYQYRYSIGDLTKDPWRSSRKLEPSQLVEGNLLSPSRHRAGGYQCWDAAIAIRACNNRKPDLVLMKDVQAVRRCNAYWSGTAVPALARIGTMTSTKDFKRPQAPYLVDLKRWTLGWRVLESAHALAHKRADDKPPQSKGPGAVTGATAGNFQRYVSEQVFAWLYGLPFDVTNRDDGKPGAPDFEHYGIELKSSSTFESPVLKLPWDGREAARVDETLVVATTGVLIEPHPGGLNDGTGRWLQRNRWCCKPSAVIVPGWVGIDFLTHQVVGVNSQWQKNTPVCYLAHPNDLLAPNLLGAYLKTVHDVRGEPDMEARSTKTGERKLWYLEDWLESDELRELIAATPPLPCPDCLMLNRKTEGVPIAPRGLRPKGKLDKNDKKHKEFIEFDKQLAVIHGIMEKATIFYEGMRDGGQTEVRRERRRRKINHKAKIKAQKHQIRVNKVLDKKRRGDALTDTDKKVYRDYLNTKTEKTNDERRS